MKSLLDVVVSTEQAYPGVYRARLGGGTSVSIRFARSRRSDVGEYPMQVESRSTCTCRFGNGDKGEGSSISTRRLSGIVPSVLIGDTTHLVFTHYTTQSTHGTELLAAKSRPSPIDELRRPIFMCSTNSSSTCWTTGCGHYHGTVVDRQRSVSQRSRAQFMAHQKYKQGVLDTEGPHFGS